MDKDSENEYVIDQSSAITKVEISNKKKFKNE